MMTIAICGPSVLKIFTIQRERERERETFNTNNSNIIILQSEELERGL